MVDIREDIMKEDREVARILRRAKKEVILGKEERGKGRREERGTRARGQEGHKFIKINWQY